MYNLYKRNAAWSDDTVAERDDEISTQKHATQANDETDGNATKTLTQVVSGGKKQGTKQRDRPKEGSASETLKKPPKPEYPPSKDSMDRTGGKCK